jgi:hypothetical protein
MTSTREAPDFLLCFIAIFVPKCLSHSYIKSAVTGSKLGKPPSAGIIAEVDKTLLEDS